MEDEGEINMENVIKKYIERIGGIKKEKLDIPNMDFAFKFKYPNPQVGRGFIVIKRKDKQIIEIFTRTHLSSEHSNTYLALPKKKKRELIKSINKKILENVLTTSLRFEDKQLFAIIEKIYFDNEEDLNINQFYKTVRRIYSCAMECVILIQDFFSKY